MLETSSECLDFAKKTAEQENCCKMMLLTGSKKPETLYFYEQAGYNSSDKTAFIQWIGMDNVSGLQGNNRESGERGSL